MRTDYRKIGLLDHMGLGNMGDAAIYDAFIMNISSRLPEATLLGFSLYPEETEKRHGLRSFPIRWSFPTGRQRMHEANSLPSNRSVKGFLKRQPIVYAFAKPFHDCMREMIHLWRSYKILSSLDLLIIAGGGQLTELYGDLPYNVFKFCALARLARTPVFMIGVGADLLEKPKNRFFAKWSVRLSNYCSFRSVESRNLIRSLGVQKKTDVCPDPAYSLSPEYVISKREEKITAAEAKNLFRPIACGVDLEANIAAEESYHQQRVKVGINPMGFCDPRRYPRKDAAIYREYLDKIEAFCLWLLAHNYCIEIFTSDIVSDVLVMEDLANRLKDHAPLESYRRISLKRCFTLRELFVQMETFDFVVTSKFHGVIFSHLLSKPVIALSYMKKIEDLMLAMGHSRYCFNIERFDPQALRERFQDLVRDSSRLKLLFHKTCVDWSDALRIHFDNLFYCADIRATPDNPLKMSSSIP